MESDVGVNKQYGINKIFKFIKNTNKNNDEKNEIISIEEKHMVSVVKIEFTSDCSFLLLSNGKVLSRSKKVDSSTTGRINSDDGYKYEKIKFCESEEDIEKDSDVLIYDISAGDDHVLALDMNYCVWGWGKNNYRQVDPKGDNIIKLPKKLNLPSENKVVQVYALNNVSAIVCKDNILYMWGSTGEGYLGNFTDKLGSDSNSVENYLKMDKVTNFIAENIKKDDIRCTEIFLNSRKLFNTKYNQTLEENNLKASRIQTLNQQIQNYKQDIEERQKKNQSMNNISNLKPSNKKIASLQELLKTYDEKLKSIIGEKDSHRKELIVIEEELNNINNDIKQIENEIGEVDKRIEVLTKLDNKSSDQEIDISNKGKVSNLHIYKEALSNNLQILIEMLQSKDGIKSNKEMSISKLNEKENNYLTSRYAIEDMIYILQEYNSMNMKPEENINNSFSDKSREKFLELVKLNDKLEIYSFLSLNQEYPFYIIDDIIALSEKEINDVVRNIDSMTSSLTEMIKENLKIMFEMIYNKVELMREQNKLIKYLYIILVNLDKNEIKNSKNNFIGLEEKTKNMNKEYIYKEMIVEFLREVYRTDESYNEITSQVNKDRLEHKKKEYIDKKKDLVKKLEHRSILKSTINTSDLTT